MKRKLFILLTALMTILPIQNNRADDSLAEVMQRMRSTNAVRIAYQETRNLALLEQPWHGSGYLYSVPPDLMIKEQLKPERLLMGIKGEQMVYFDPSQNIRHQSEMTQDNPMSYNIGAFKALMNADKNLLNRLYFVKFTSFDKHWSMSLKPWHSRYAGIGFVISGPAGQQADKIEVTEAEGDSSIYSLQKDKAGSDVGTMAQRLYRELMGD